MKAKNVKVLPNNTITYVTYIFVPVMFGKIMSFLLPALFTW